MGQVTPRLIRQPGERLRVEYAESRLTHASPPHARPAATVATPTKVDLAMVATTRAGNVPHRPSQDPPNRRVSLTKSGALWSHLHCEPPVNPLALRRGRLDRTRGTATRQDRRDSVARPRMSRSGWACLTIPHGADPCGSMRWRVAPCATVGLAWRPANARWRGGVEHRFRARPGRPGQRPGGAGQLRAAGVGRRPALPIHR